MAIYKCLLCGHQYNEEKEGVKWEDLPEDWVCPLCKSPKSAFVKVEETESRSMQEEIKKLAIQTKEEVGQIKEEVKKEDLHTPLEWNNPSKEVDLHMKEIHEMAVSGKTIIEPMGTMKPVIGWEDIVILGAQLNPMPLEANDEVIVETIIGKKAKKPMILAMPVYVSHMSFGALSKEIKIALAKGSAMAKTAMCSGEGGILPEEKQEAYRYIFEYVPNGYSVNDENLKQADAIEIKIGQGTKPGMGGHLPGEKVTQEIAQIRNKPMGEDIISPSKFSDIQNQEDLKQLVISLRQRSEGRPIGIKIAAGHIEKDMEIIAYAQPDFVTIDGRGGATGASPKGIKDSTSVPTIFALYRAKKYILEHKLEIDLVITGGLRVSSDFAKAIAMGADAIAVSSAPLMAAACQQYKICHNGACPMGIATQDGELRKRLDVQRSSKRVANYFEVVKEELKTYARITGHRDIHMIDIEDIATVNSEIADYTNIAHV